MTQQCKIFSVICLSLLALALITTNTKAIAADALGNVLKNGFPTQPGALEKVTQSLKNEYDSTGNVATLVFYAYGLLRQANIYSSTNDFINASEYVKTGFFWLDEAVELHENDARVRYLRARVDAYLPGNSGRCVVTIKDTERMLEDKKTFTAQFQYHIYSLRYRALHNCKDYIHAKTLLAQIQQNKPDLAKSLINNFNSEPEWDRQEITQVLLPLLKGE